MDVGGVAVDAAHHIVIAGVAYGLGGYFPCSYTADYATNQTFTDIDATQGRVLFIAKYDADNNGAFHYDGFVVKTDALMQTTARVEPYQGAGSERVFGVALAKTNARATIGTFDDKTPFAVTQGRSFTSSGNGDYFVVGTAP